METVALKSDALDAQDLIWRFYERVKDKLDHLKAGPVTEEVTSPECQI